MDQRVVEAETSRHGRWTVAFAPTPSSPSNLIQQREDRTSRTERMMRRRTTLFNVRTYHIDYN